MTTIWKEFMYNGRYYRVSHPDRFLNTNRCKVVILDTDGALHSTYVHKSRCTPEYLESHFKLLKNEFIAKR